MGFSPAGRGGPSAAAVAAGTGRVGGFGRDAAGAGAGVGSRSGGGGSAAAGAAAGGLARRRLDGRLALAGHLEAHKLGTDGQHAADLAAQRGHGPRHRRRDLDRRLVGHDGGQDLVLQHRVADLDVPFDDLGLGHAFADVGKLDDARAHLRPPSRP